MPSIQKGLLIFFTIGIIATLYGLWLTTPRASKPGSCRILEEKFCNKGQILKLQETSYIAFEDLPTETTIYAPIDGERTTAKISPGSSESQLQGSLISIFPSDRSINYTFIGDLSWPTDPNIKAGETIGSITNTGIKNFGKYNLLFTIGKRNTSSGRLEVDIESLNKLFPKTK